MEKLAKDKENIYPLSHMLAGSSIPLAMSCSMVSPGLALLPEVL